MDNVKNDQYYVEKIRKDLQFIVDLNIVYKTLTEDVPELLEMLKNS